MKKTVIVFLMWSAAVCLHASVAGTGSVFELGMGVRQQAMGGAYAAGTDDSSSLYYNPAWLGTLDRMEIQAAYIPVIFDTVYNYAVFGLPTLDFGGFGVSYAGIGTPDIIFRDSKGMEQSKANQQFFEIQAGWGQEMFFLNKLYAGVSMKLDYQSIGQYKGSGFGIDLGFGYTVLNEGGNRLNIGFNCKNILEPVIKLGTAADILLRNYIIGAAYSRELFSPDFTLNILSDAVLAQGADFVYRGGMELGFFKMFFLRGGYNTYGETSLGAGINILNTGSADYGFFMTDLPAQHRVSVKVRFGDDMINTRLNRKALEEKKLEEKAREYAGKEMADLKKALAEARDKFKTNLQEKMQDAVKAEYFKARHYSAGLDYYYKGDLKTAYVEFETVFKLDEGYLNTAYYMSLIKNALGSSRDRQYSEAVLALYRAGVQKYMAEDFAGAKTEWEKILKIDPYNKLAIDNLKEVKEILLEIEKIKGQGK